MIYVWAVVLIAVVLLSWALNLLSLPGNWLIVLATFLYTLFGPVDSRVAIGWGVVATLVVLAVVGELIEFLAGVYGAARQGGSRRGAIFALGGSILGGIVGAIVGLPIPIVGPIVAAMLLASLGALAGAVIGENSLGREWGASWQIGKGAFWGRMFGTLGKIVTGSVMVVVVAVALLF